MRVQLRRARRRGRGGGRGALRALSEARGLLGRGEGAFACAGMSGAGGEAARAVGSKRAMTKAEAMAAELMREDQMMMGLWDQKLRRKPQVLESMFGADISLKVGVSVKQRKDVKIGFGRQNRNAMKNGRERRGKKNVKH